MKNWKSATTACFILTGLITAASAQSEPAAGANGGPVAPRTGLYTNTTMSNAAADNTVDDYTKRPTLIQGKQYFAGFGGANLANGAYAFQAIGYDWFGSVISTNGTGTVHTGLATSAWGGGVFVDFNKTTVKTAGVETKTVLDGDGFGLFGNFKLGNSDVYGEAGMLTGPGNYVKTTGPAPTETNPTTFRILAGWKKDATTQGTHALNAEMTMNIRNLEVNPGSNKTSGYDLSLVFSHGFILKSNESYSVFLGDNSTFTYNSTNNPGAIPDPDHTGISVLPNIAYQKILGKGFEISAGGSAGLSWDSYSNTAVPPGVAFADEGTKILSPDAGVNLGLRWVKDNFALEGSLNEALIQHGPDFISGGAGGFPMFAQVGVSLGI